MTDYRRSLFLLLLLFIPVATAPARAEQDGQVQILLLGDSTTEGSVPRRLKPAGPHLEHVVELLLKAKGDLPPCQVVNSSLSGEYIRRLIDSGRYERDVSKLPGIDYIFVRYGLNDRVRREQFETSFLRDYEELIGLLRRDHPQAQIIPTTVIPFADEAASRMMNDLIRQVASTHRLALFDIYPGYAAALTPAPNMLNYRRYPLERVPEQFHELVRPYVHRERVEVMDNELDAVLGHLPGWYADRHPNLAGYNVIARETADYLEPLLRQRATP